MKPHGWVVVALACLVTLVMTAVAVSAKGAARAAQDRLLAFQQDPPVEPDKSDTGDGLPSTLGPAQRLRSLEQEMHQECPVSTTHRVYGYDGFLIAVADFQGSSDDDDLSRCLTLLAKANADGKGIAILKVTPMSLILPDGNPGQVLWQFHYILAGPDGMEWLLLKHRTDEEVVQEVNHSIQAFIAPRVIAPFTGLRWEEVFSVFIDTGVVPQEDLRNAPRGERGRTWDW
jgi:hypothetical protein